MTHLKRLSTRAYRWVVGMRLVRRVARRLPAVVQRTLRRLLGKAPSGPQSAPVPVAQIGSDLGATFIGHFQGEFGMAEAARSLVMAARAVGVQAALIEAAPSEEPGSDRRLAHLIGAEAPHPVNVICANGGDSVQLMDALGPDVTAGRYNIGFWFWELARLPDPWRAALDRLDEVWVASAFVADAVAASTSKPVSIVRLAVDATPSRTYRRERFGIPDDVYCFLFTFSFNSHVARKNPLGVVRAFRRAFPVGDERVALVLKSTHGQWYPDPVRQLRDAIEGDHRIRLIDGFMSRDRVFGLESVVDAYVSLHRSEGFGLGLAESMFLAKPVIGTAYSGNLEFMNSTNSCLVDYELTAVGESEYPFAAGQVWAEPDEVQAADAMRRLVRDRKFGRALGARARAHMLAQFSPAAVGARIVGRLAQLRGDEP